VTFDLGPCLFACLPFLRTPKVILTELDEEEDFFAIVLVYLFLFQLQYKYIKNKNTGQGGDPKIIYFLLI
jgi:hypothetical protein